MTILLFLLIESLTFSVGSPLYLSFPRMRESHASDNLNSTVTSNYVLTTDNKKIKYDHYLNGHSQVIILAHGFYNSKQAVLFKQMAADLSDAYDVIVFDFRGHGESEGVFTWTAREPKDLEAVVDYAHKSYQKVGVVGFSLGAASSLILAAQSDKITSLIAVSPPTKFRQVDFHFWKMGMAENIVYNTFQEGRIGKGVRPGLLWHKKTHPINVVDQIQTPTMFVHGQEDWLILPGHSKKLYEKAKCQKQLNIVEGGTHAEYLYRSDKEGIMDMFKEWFQLTLL